MKTRHQQTINKIFATPENYLILDTETTKLDEPEILELAIATVDKNIIFATTLNPKTKISKAATEINGLTDWYLADSPTFADIYQTFVNIIKGKEIITFNQTFHFHAIEYTCNLWQLECPQLNQEPLCAQALYMNFYGMTYLPPLLNKTNRAKEDVLRIVDLLVEMKTP